MQENQISPDAMPAAGFTTIELAKLTRVQPESIRISLCRRGHFNGLRPIKLPNRRLLWKAEDVARLLSGA